jgi:hypothetical protein
MGTSKDGFAGILALYEYLKRNFSIFQTKRYRSSIDLLERKLIQFVEENQEFEKVGIHYLQELFPETYQNVYLFGLYNLFEEKENK